MSLFKSRKTSVVIFACLAFISLLAFQNCSQAVHLFGSSQPAQASNIDEMIRETEKEIKVTKAVMSGATRRQVNEIKRIPTYSNSADKKNLQITLKSKRPRKNKTRPVLIAGSSAHKTKPILKKTAKNLKTKQTKKIARLNQKSKVMANKNSKLNKLKNQKKIAKKQNLKIKKAQGIAKKKSKNPKPKFIAKNTRKETK